MTSSSSLMRGSLLPLWRRRLVGALGDDLSRSERREAGAAQGKQFTGRHGTGIEPALHDVTPEVVEVIGLPGALDAFGDGAQAEGPREVHDGGGDGAVLHV